MIALFTSPRREFDFEKNCVPTRLMNVNADLMVVDFASEP